MAIQVLPSLRRVLIGSMLLLMSAACRNTERSGTGDTTSPPQQGTGSQTIPAPTTPQNPSSPTERIHVTGRDDDQLELGAGGGTSGSAGTGARASH